MASASHTAIFTAPPPVVTPYKPAEALSDLPGVAYALDLFLSSKMHESEDYMNASDAKKERLYFATGYGLIQCVKGLMSYADEDLLAATAHTKQGVLIASQHRKRAPYLASRLAGLVVSAVSSGGSASVGVGFIRSMTPVERHAELVYAESLFEKALLGIVYSGDWLAFVREALNMRTIITIYRSLYKYILAVDAEYAAEQGAAGKGGGATESPALDAHFRSGVYLGAGMSTLILSLLPARLLNIIELFGYRADRKEGLEVLGRAGGWNAVVKQSSMGAADTADPNSNKPKDGALPGPTVSTAQEGVRRAICDMALLIFHLVLSSFTFDGVDVQMAARIVEWNLKRYPEGVFFLFGAGRLALARSQPTQAIAYYTHAMAVQAQYRNLWHISWWEMAIAHLALGDERASLACWRDLEREATWSKAIYSYGMAVCLLEAADEEESFPAELLAISASGSQPEVTASSEANATSATADAAPASGLASEAGALSIGDGGDKRAEANGDVKDAQIDKKEKGKGKTNEKKKGEPKMDAKARHAEATRLMERVPGLRQKIAGKSIPLEKFVARKARKFLAQGGRLALPALEIGYVFLAIAHAPRTVVEARMLPSVRRVLAELGVAPSGSSSDGVKDAKAESKEGKKDGEKEGKEAKKAQAEREKKDGYWDDYCLARFLEGVCLRYVAFPDPDAVLDPTEVPHVPQAEAAAGAKTAFEAVFEHGPKIELDHHLVYHAHYELGRLMACLGDATEAKRHFDLVLSGKYLEVGPSGRKGRYSMENALQMRTHAAVEALHQKRL